MISGLLPVIKPQGPSSAAVVGHVKQLTHIRHLGHAGTLDPQAEGVLVMAFNRATRLLPYMPTDKAYRAVIRLGITTDTLDAAGVILTHTTVPTLTPETAAALLQQFAGEQLQTPPMISARHHQGRRLYKLARQGEAIELTPTPVAIHSLKLISLSLPDLECEIACSRGTYIRSLARDLGEQLGCGAILQHLTRTRCSGFSLAQAVSLDTLETRVQAGTWEELLVSPNQALAHLPAWPVSAGEQRAVQNGCAVPVSRNMQVSGQASGRIVDARGRLLAIARPQDGWLKIERVFCPANEEAA